MATGGAPTAFDTASYEVEIHRIDDHGEQVFTHAGTSSGADDRLVFAYAAWTGNGAGTHVGIAHGDDGKIDEEVDLSDGE